MSGLKCFLIVAAIVSLTVLAGRLLYWNAGLPLWACLLIATPPGGAAFFAVAWLRVTEEEGS